jgi:hypothetical protein
MRTHITVLMALLLAGAGIAHAQCVTYSLGYDVYTSESLDNIQQGQGAPIPGSGSVDIGGYEQSAQICTQHLAGGDCGRYRTQYDYGTVSITVNGFSESASYGPGDSASTIAVALASAFNNDGSSPVTASVNGSTVSLTAKTNGAGTNYSLSTTSSTEYPSDFDGPSFYATPSGSALTGGADAGTLGDLLTSVVVDGSATMTLDQTAPGCDPATYGNLVAELPYATHTPSVTNIVNGVGGTVTGAAGCVTCYLSEQVNDSTPVTLELSTTSSTSGQVYCSVGGLIFFAKLSDYFEFAFTWMSKNGPPLIVGTNYIYPVTQNCSNGTPDWYPGTLEDSSSHAANDVRFWSGNFMVRASTTAYWTPLEPIGFTLVGYTSAYPPEPCTHTGPSRALGFSWTPNCDENESEITRRCV